MPSGTNEVHCLAFVLAHLEVATKFLTVTPTSSPCIPRSMICFPTCLDSKFVKTPTPTNGGLELCFLELPGGLQRTARCLVGYSPLIKFLRSRR